MIRDRLVVEAKLQELASETDAAFVKDIVSEFLDASPALLGEMHRSLATKDLATAGRTAHSLKGNCATFGLIQLAAALEHFEVSCRRSHTGEAMSRLLAIQGEYAESTAVLAHAVKQAF